MNARLKNKERDWKKRIPKIMASTETINTQMDWKFRHSMLPWIKTAFSCVCALGTNTTHALHNASVRGSALPVPVFAVRNFPVMILFFHFYFSVLIINT